MASWIRGDFDGVGLTQSPPGRYLAALQARHGGTVLLCLDISGSMSGEPLRQAASGGILFLTEAFAAHYRCGLILWNSGIHLYLPPGSSPKSLRTALTSASATGGTNLDPTLLAAQDVLGPLTGDRVLCVFSDGHIGTAESTLGLARALCAMGIRIVVRGLGTGAAESLARLACPGASDDRQVVVDVGDISASIASMATGLSRRRGGDRNG